MSTLYRVAAGAVMLGALTLAAGAGAETYKANLTAGQEVPPVDNAAAKGTAEVNLDPATKQITYTVNYSGLSGPATASHIHGPAAPGANAGVAVPFTKQGESVPNPITGTATLNDAQIADLKAGKMYVNVHTAQNKGGELRGQLAP